MPRYDPPLGAVPPLDTDGGPNDLQSFPIIDSARTGPSSTRINGRVLTDPGKTYRLES